MFCFKSSFRNERVMAILSWVSQRALWLRRISLAMNFDDHCRLIFCSICKSKILLKRSLSYLNINVFFWKFVSKWDSYGHSKSGKSKSAVASPAPYQLYASLYCQYWCRSWGAREASQAPWCAAIILKAVWLRAAGGWWVDRLQNDCRTPWCLRGFPGTSAPTPVETGIEVIRRRRSHSTLWLYVYVRERPFQRLSCLNCLLSWDKNLINHDFHRRTLREVKFKRQAIKNPGKVQAWT